MNYAGIKYCDIANGLGCRTVLFVSGCRNACKGCFQPQTWDFTYGECFDEQVQQKVLYSLKPEIMQPVGFQKFPCRMIGHRQKYVDFTRTLMKQKEPTFRQLCKLSGETERQIGAYSNEPPHNLRDVIRPL